MNAVQPSVQEIVKHLPMFLTFEKRPPHLRGVKAVIKTSTGKSIRVLPRVNGLDPQAGEKWGWKHPTLVKVSEHEAVIEITPVPMPISVRKLGLKSAQPQEDKPKIERPVTGQFIDPVVEKRLAKMRARRKPDGPANRREREAALAKLARMKNVSEHETPEMRQAFAEQRQMLSAPVPERGKVIPRSKKEANKKK